MAHSSATADRYLTTDTKCRSRTEVRQTLDNQRVHECWFDANCLLCVWAHAPPAICKLDLPLSLLSLNPVLAAYFSANSWRTCFVSPSAGVSSPRIFRYTSSDLNAFSCNHRLRTLICRSFPAPSLFAMPRAAEASANRGLGPGQVIIPHSVAIVLTPSTSAANLPSATSSASAELKVTES